MFGSLSLVKTSEPRCQWALYEEKKPISLINKKYLNAGTGKPWAGHTRLAAPSLTTNTTSNLSLETTFGGALPMGSGYVLKNGRQSAIQI